MTCPEWQTDAGKLTIPVGKYQGALGYLLLDESAVTIHKKILFKTVERRIPYDQVATVAFEKDDEHKSGGFICIRSVQDKAIPLIRKENAGSDETSLRFIYTENEAMQKVAEFLEKAVQVNRETFGISATEEVDKASELCCPQCMSRNIRCQARRSRSYVRTRVYTTPMARLIGSIIVLIATIISVCVKEYWYTCQECGFQWTSKKQ